MTSLDLSDDTREHRRGGRKGVAFVALLLVILLAGVGFLGYEGWRRTTAIEGQLAVLSERMDRATLASQQALERANAAQAAALAAAEGRSLAEAQTGQAQGRAELFDPGYGVRGVGRAPAGQDATDLVEAGQGR